MSIDSLTGFEAMCGCFTGLTVIAVALRFVARKKNQLTLKADDWLMLAALIFFLGNMTTVYLLARVNFSGYNGDQGSNQVTIFVEQVTFAFQLLIVWTLGAAKASVLFFYKRVFCQHRGMNNHFRMAIYVTLVINACWIIAVFLLGLFQCGNHFSYGGNHFSYCTLLNQYQQAFYISDVILDAWIMIMPMPYITRLHISRLRKLLCIVVFLLSFISLGASIARLVNYLQSTHVNPGASHHTSGTAPKRTRSAWTTYTWFGTLEMGMAIVAINAPVLYGLFAKHAPELLLQITRSWTSIASRAVSTSDKFSTGHRGGSEISEVNHERLKYGPAYNSMQTFADVDTGRILSANGLRADEVHVPKIVQTSSETTHQEV